MHNSTIKILVKMPKIEPTGIPRYRDQVYDPDPEKSYTKAKVEKLKTGSGTATFHEQIDGENLHSSIIDTFPADDNTQFSKDFSVLPPFVPMDAFEQVKNLVNQ